MSAADPGVDPAADQAAADRDEAREFARAFRRFLRWVHHDSDDRARDNPVVVLVREFLGDGATAESVVSRGLPVFEHVNLQAALDAWSSASGRSVDLHGLHTPIDHERPRLESLVGGELHMPLRLGAPSYADLPNGPGTTLACLALALLLVTDERGRYAVLVSGPAEHERGIRLEIAGLPVAAAQEVFAELDDLRHRLNVYRGHVIEVSSGGGGVSLSFAPVPQTVREDVILPAEVLARIERHALEVARHRDALRARGQHLKRGVLLFGPPGTGKTLTTGYLVGAMTGYTRFLLSGQSLHAVGSLAKLARDLEPAVVVLEDVDLVAEDRDFGDGASPVLFELLDAMDGAAADADLLFLLTTNRADTLEAALAARPGRVDVAVEIGLPDAEARRRLLTRYGRTVSLELSDTDVDAAVERMEGVTASFVKELLRRAVLESLLDAADDNAAPSETVTAVHLNRALDDLLDSAQEVTRTLLGVGYDPEAMPPPRRPQRRYHGHYLGLASAGQFGLDVSYDDEYDDED